MHTVRTAARDVELLALLLAAPGCGARRSAVPQGEVATLRVENRSALDVNVFAVRSGIRSRLGLVTGNGSATFRIPSNVVCAGNELTFLADPVGSAQTAHSFSIYVRPGERVTLTVPPRF